MKNLTEKQTLNLLKILKKNKDLIKKSETREKGYTQLKEIDKDSLSVGLLIYFYYIEGKYHFLTYKETGNIESLERANDSYDELIYTARDNGTFVKNPKFLFVRAHVKWVLSQELTHEKSKNYFLKNALFLTEKALEYNSENTSFKWLIKEINSKSSI